MTTATETAAAAGIAANDAVIGVDGAIHAAKSVSAKGNVTTVCDVVLNRKTVKPVSEPIEGAQVCATCMGQPALEQPEQESPNTESPVGEAGEAQESHPQASAPELAAKLEDLLDQAAAAEQQEQPQDAPKGWDSSATGATDQEQPSEAETETPGSRIANQPKLADIVAGKVGNFELIEHRNEGQAVFGLRGPDGKLLRDGNAKAYRFTDRADAAWYAQRRYRLSQYEGFGGSRKLFMPKVQRTVTSDWGVQFEIRGDLGSVQVYRDGDAVGPIWSHPTNGLVDAMRYVERLARKPAA